jgi:type IV secretion system protein VirB2
LQPVCRIDDDAGTLRIAWHLGSGSTGNRNGEWEKAANGHSVHYSTPNRDGALSLPATALLLAIVRNLTPAKLPDMATSPSFSYASPAAESSLVNAVGWVQNVLTGQLGIAVAVLAIAFIGFRMLQGHLASRSGLTAILGCFILFGAPSFAREIVKTVHRTVNFGPVATKEITIPATPEQFQVGATASPIGANPFDPYGGGISDH